RPQPPTSTPFPYTTLFRSGNAVLYPRFEMHPAAPEPLRHLIAGARLGWKQLDIDAPVLAIGYSRGGRLVMDYAAKAHGVGPVPRDRKSTRLNSSHDQISYA